MTRYPTEISMGIGSGPEGIVIAEGSIAFVSSLKTGEIFRVDLSTGERSVFHRSLGPTTVGLALDAFGRLFVCGGIDGTLSVIDTATGELLKRYQLGGENSPVNKTDRSFINEMALSPEVAYITDSFSPVLYRMPFGAHGELPEELDIVAVPLIGDLVYQFGETFAEWFNSNGISFTPDRSAILIVQTNTGRLFRVDTRSGATREVDLGGELLEFGDGLVLEGRTLHAVQNMANTVSVVELDETGGSGRIVERWTDPRFDTPTAMARFGNRFYLSNARFTEAHPESVDFSIVAIEK